MSPQMNTMQASTSQMDCRKIARRAFGLVTLAVGLNWTISAAQADDGAAMIAEAKPAIEKANSDWLPAIQKQDAKGLVEAYADNGVFITTKGQTVTGKDAIQKMYEARFPMMKVLDGKIIEDGITAQGKVIYEWGHADISAEMSGKQSTFTGRYLTVWQKSTTGEWQIIRNLTF